MRKTIFGLVIGLMIGLSTNAFAAIGDKVEAVFAEFVFVVNGEVKTLDAVPIVINGSSYLPVRSVANILGYDLTYKADLRTIEFNKNEQAMLNEVNTVLATGVEKMAVAETVWTLENIDKSINSYKDSVAINEIWVEAWEKQGKLDSLEKAKISLAEAKAKLAELEAIKAGLLAQP